MDLNLSFTTLTSQQLWASSLCILFLLYAIQKVRQYRKLSHFPTVTLGGWTNWWRVLAQLSGRYHLENLEASRRYGSIVRTAPDELLTDDPAIIRHINGVRGNYCRAPWYGTIRLDPDGDSMFSTRDEPIHEMLRAQSAAGYSGKDVEGFEASVDKQLANLVRVLRERYVCASPTEAKVCDIGRLVQYYTLDIITNVAFGKEIGDLDSEKDIHDIMTISETVIPVNHVCQQFWIMDKIVGSNLFRKLMGPKKTDTRGMGVLLRQADEMVADRFGPNAKATRDMLGSFIRHGMSELHCRREIPFQILAGADTTSAVIRMTLLNIITAPTVFTKLKTEIFDATSRGLVSTPIKVDEAKRLPYLQAILHEGLRLYPPGTAMFLKQVPPGGDTLNGKFVPGGTKIGISVYSLMRHESIFGHSPDIFLPERWIEADLERRREMERTVDLAFGTGRWGCMGKPLAWLEMDKTFFELLRNFDFQVLNPERPCKIRHFGIGFIKDFRVRVLEALPPGLVNI